MCSYQNISDANYGNLPNENWEENLWENVLSPNSNTSSSSTYRSQAHIPVDSHSVESCTNLLPIWESAAYQVPQTCTRMSTYFSTFDPSSQFQDISAHTAFATNTSNANTQHIANVRKSHQVRINVVPTKNGSFKAIVKRKRKRTMFTTEQLEALEEVYSKKPYVTREERQILVQQLQVNDKSVKIWFQNRRLKNKRNDDQDNQDSANIFDRINTVEAEIKERTDEFGFVTLDDKLMSDLVNVIDDYFANNSRTSPAETKIESDNCPIYEPISPVSADEYSCEENSTWQHNDYEPNVVVEELMGIESTIAF